MKIRRLTGEDWPEVDRGMADLHELHVRNRPDVYIPREHVLPEAVFVQMCADPEHVLLCAEEGEMAGFVLASVRKRSFMVNMRTLYLEELYVFPAWRRRGTGTALLRAAEEAGLENGCERMDLMVWDFNEAARCLYASEGFACQSMILEKPLKQETRGTGMAASERDSRSRC